MENEKQTLFIEDKSVALMLSCQKTSGTPTDSTLMLIACINWLKALMHSRMNSQLPLRMETI
jgi:hypothetical protein